MEIRLRFQSKHSQGRDSVERSRLVLHNPYDWQLTRNSGVPSLAPGSELLLSIYDVAGDNKVHASSSIPFIVSRFDTGLGTVNSESAKYLRSRNASTAFRSVYRAQHMG
jgi:hypothetical protein